MPTILYTLFLPLVLYAYIRIVDQPEWAGIRKSLLVRIFTRIGHFLI